MTLCTSCLVALLSVQRKQEQFIGFAIMTTIKILDFIVEGKNPGRQRIIYIYIYIFIYMFNHFAKIYDGFKIL
jgi:hypothetical protein